MKAICLLLLASTLAPGQSRKHLRQIAPAVPPSIPIVAPSLVASQPDQTAFPPPLAPTPEPPLPTDPAQPTLAPEQVIFEAEAAALYLQKAIEEHAARETRFRPHKQQPEDILPNPPMLERRGGGCYQDWTISQHARFLMEKLRQGIHAVHTAEYAWTIDILALESARRAWPQVRDLFCAANPEAVYYDTDGFRHYCPAK
jgi:hypothetical protein